MVSDAIWTGKPVGLIPVTKSALGRAAFALMDFVRPGKRIYPQDLRFFWRALTNAGVTEHLAAPTTSTEDEMRTVLGKLRPGDSVTARVLRGGKVVSLSAVKPR